VENILFFGRADLRGEFGIVELFRPIGLGGMRTLSRNSSPVFGISPDSTNSAFFHIGVYSTVAIAKLKCWGDSRAGEVNKPL
jgi:hypothetical protein